MNIISFIKILEDIDSDVNYIVEDDSILKIHGENYNSKISNLYSKIIEENLDFPNVELLYETEDKSLLNTEEIFDDDIYDKNYSWRFTLDKGKVLTEGKDYEYIFYYCKKAFYDNFSNDNVFSHLNENFDYKIRVFVVNSLKKSFGGGNLYILSPQDMGFSYRKSTLPSSEDIHKLIHVNSSEAIRVTPRSLSFEWGGLDNFENDRIKRNSAKILASCLVHELIIKQDVQKVTIKGNRKLTIILSDDNEEIDSEFLLLLNEAVIWVYEERSETRLQLIMDRLSLDINEDSTYLSSLSLNLKKSLEQAKDSYTFVILERKDNYYKEVRELIKDMKGQADLYAIKIRNLISSITRDLLGVLVFFSFSFLSRVQKIDVETLLNSKGFPIVSKILSFYLFLSLLLQLLAHLRDDKLTKKENERWLDILQNYSNTEDKKKNFLTPIEERRSTFFIALKVFTFIYLFAAFSVWNLSDIIVFVLDENKNYIFGFEFSSFKLYYENLKHTIMTVIKQVFPFNSFS